MNDILSFVPGGKAGIGKVLETNWNSEEVQSFINSARQNFESDNAFREEIFKAGFKTSAATNSVQKDEALALDGLTSQEKEQVLNSLASTESSSVGVNLGSDLEPILKSQPKDGSFNWSKATLIALAIAAIAAIVLFRGVVFRALYLLVCKLPWIGPVVRSKFGEPKEIFSGKLSDNNVRNLIKQIKELEGLTGLRGSVDDTPRLVRFLELVRSLNLDDVREAYDAAKDYQLLK